MPEMFWFIVVGSAVGCLAGLLVKSSRIGLIGYCLTGVVGAIIGRFAFRLVHVEGEGMSGALVVAAFGAALLIFDLRLMQKSNLERRNLQDIFRRYTSMGKLHLAPRPQREANETCMICGQKHPTKR